MRQPGECRQTPRRTLVVLCTDVLRRGVPLVIVNDQLGMKGIWSRNNKTEKRTCEFFYPAAELFKEAKEGVVARRFAILNANMIQVRGLGNPSQFGQNTMFNATTQDPAAQIESLDNEGFLLVILSIHYGASQTVFSEAIAYLDRHNIKCMPACVLQVKFFEDKARGVELVCSLTELCDT